MAAIRNRLPWIILGLLGAGALWLAAGYGFGTLRVMQAGMVPGILGGLLVAVSLVGVVGPAFSGPVIAVRPLVFVVAAMACFMATIAPFGLVPAAFVGAVVAYLGQSDRRPLPALCLGAAVAAAVWLIFPVLLALPAAAFRWPS